MYSIILRKYFPLHLKTRSHTIYLSQECISVHFKRQILRLVRMVQRGSTTPETWRLGGVFVNALLYSVKYVHLVNSTLPDVYYTKVDLKRIEDGSV